MMKQLPKEIPDILHSYDAPLVLERHLTLVYHTALELLSRFQTSWPDLELNHKAVLFGAATHDIGKITEEQELHQKGSKHEQAGYELLLDMGIEESLARFTKTHGNWKDENLEIEDLVVTLADKAWKGKRIHELEERLSRMISERTASDYWEIVVTLDRIISEITLGADERLNWQNRPE